MSRLGEPIITIGRAESGIESGDFDYTVNCRRIGALRLVELKEISVLLDNIKDIVNVAIDKEQGKDAKD